LESEYNRNYTPIINFSQELCMADPFEDLLEEQEPKPKKKRSRPKKGRGIGCFLNLLTGILVAATMVVALVFIILFINPQMPFNPFPPPTQPILVLTNTPTPTPKGLLPATWTPTSSPTTVPTFTPVPTDTPEPTPENSPVPTADIESGTFFAVQQGSPTYEINSVRPDAGCNWLGVAGQVFDSAGDPISGILVEVAGTIADNEISRIALTGSSPEYGEGGYEIVLGDAPVASEGQIYIQLLDQANLPLSEQFSFDTFDNCDSNLIKINFDVVEGE
jgi:hypothetical protein